MPIVFEQMDPMGYASSIGVGAGEAAATQKMAPTLAQLYEHIADLRQRSAMSGGGGGSSSTTPGGGGVGPGYYGGGGGSSDYDVQAQANREQSALNLGAQLNQPDYVGQHIQAEQQFKVQQQQALQAREAALNQPTGQPAGQPPAQPAPEFTPFDQKNLDEARQTVNTIESGFMNGEYGPEDSDALEQRQQALAQVADLQTKQRHAVQYKIDQDYQNQSEGMAKEGALLDHAARHTEANGFRPIPDLPVPRNRIDPHTGKEYMANEVVYKVAAAAQEKAKEYNHKLELEGIKQKADAEKAKLAAEKETRAAEADYLRHYGETAKHVDKLEDEFVKLDQAPDPENGGKYQRRRKDPKERAEAIGDHMEAMGMARNLQDYRAQRNGGRASQIPTERQPGSEGSTGGKKGIVAPERENDAFHALLGDLYSAKPSAAVPKASDPPKDRGTAQLDFSGMGQW